MKQFETTPIHKLSENLNKNTFFIKRDDLLPLSFGGNKARKAILFLKDIKAQKADCVVTYGSDSSNHCRIISNLSAARGLPCHIISPLEASKFSFNSKMIQLFGAKVTKCPVSDVRVTIDKKIEELRVQGKKPYFIQGGGHGNIGTQAYVDAYEEIVKYEEIVGVHFDYIFHASGTGTTQAGLLCGKIIDNHNKNIIGISIARKNPYGGQIILDSVNDYLASIGKDSVSAEVINFIDDYVLDGYGDYNDNILQTIQKILIKYGIPFDTTYTGKAFWGMKEYIKKKQIIGKNILFIHTGGIPLFFDYLGDIVE